MKTIIENPIYLLFLLPLLFIFANWWYIAFIYNDVRKRGIKNKMGWSILAFFLGPWMLPIYNAKTLREQTSLTSSIAGVISGEKLERVSRKGKLVWASVFLILILISLIKPFSYSSFTDFMASKNADRYLYGILSLIVIFLYSITSVWQKGKLNPLDKPLMGMRETPEGYLVDESLTKHKKVVIFLVVLIIAVPVLTLAFLILSR